ncbi:unnamed protein product [Dicrocoelium dendriticum]|nr:unnamed protein product [Dicrocoelium dendriticum]
MADVPLSLMLRMSPPIVVSTTRDQRTNTQSTILHKFNRAHIDVNMSKAAYAYAKTHAPGPTGTDTYAVHVARTPQCINKYAPYRNLATSTPITTPTPYLVATHCEDIPSPPTENNTHSLTTINTRNQPLTNINAQIHLPSPPLRIIHTGKHTHTTRQ